jgi:hypothetical protein
MKVVGQKLRSCLFKIGDIVRKKNQDPRFIPFTFKVTGYDLGGHTNVVWLVIISADPIHASWVGTQLGYLENILIKVKQ